MADLPPITIARFWSKIAVKGEHDCWPWNAATSDSDYGRFKVDGRLYLPHRLAYELVNGTIPESPDYHGTVVMHRCDNPKCCNPNHLRLGTQADNVRDMDEKSRRRLVRPNAKLTVEQVLKIREDPRSGRTIAKEYGIGNTQVQRIKAGVRWADLSTGQTAEMAE